MSSDLITMDDLTNDEILELLEQASSLLPVARGESYLPLLQGKVLGNMFFEPSTRTRMSFGTAMKRLGGSVVNLGALASSSVAKGETLYDTMRMVDGYCDDNNNNAGCDWARSHFQSQSHPWTHPLAHLCPCVSDVCVSPADF